MKSVKIDEKVHKKTKVKCAELGVNITDVANSLFQKFLNGEITYELEYKK